MTQFPLGTEGRGAEGEKESGIGKRKKKEKGL